MRSRAPAQPLRLSALFVLLAGSWLAMLVGGNGPVDLAVFDALYAGTSPALVAAARIVTALGEPTVLIGASAVVAIGLWLAGHHRLAPAFFAITTLARVLNQAQKYWIGRERPDLEGHLVIVKSMSFPSGHATSSMVFYLTLALVLTRGSRWRGLAVAAALLLAFLVGLSRVMLGVHWPSDVIGGWAFGILWVLLTLRIADRWVEGGVRR